jgi:hypothetical protein
MAQPDVGDLHEHRHVVEKNGTRPTRTALFGEDILRACDLKSSFKVIGRCGLRF